MQERYARNYPLIDHAEQQKLSKCSVLVVGCGGLGGFLCELLSRIGIGNIYIADPERFEPTNLNRQRFSSMDSIGEIKSIAACSQLKVINPDINVFAINSFIDEKYLIKNGHLFDVVLDATDSINSRMILESGCSKANKLLIHAAVSGNIGQVAAIRPKSDLLSRIYSTSPKNKKASGILAPTVAITAGYQAKECISALLKPKDLLPDNALLLINGIETKVIYIHE